MDELLSEFLTETGESLDQIDVGLVRFEQEPNDADMLNAIFRLVHTVKGTCGFLGLDRLAKLTHAAETLMGQYRDGASVTVEGVSVILASIDRIKEILAGIERDGVEPPGSDADLIGALQTLADAGAAGSACRRRPTGDEGGIRRVSRPEAGLRCRPRSTSWSALGAKRRGRTRCPIRARRQLSPPRTRPAAESRRPELGGPGADRAGLRRYARAFDDDGERTGAHPQSACSISCAAPTKANSRRLCSGSPTSRWSCRRA